MAAETNQLIQARFSLHRNKTGAPVVADVLGAAMPDKAYNLSTLGYETIVVVPVLTGGVAPTVELTPYLYDPDEDVFYSHTSSGSLSSGQAIEVAAMGYRLFILISTVTGNPTGVALCVGPGRRSRMLEE